MFLGTSANRPTAVRTDSRRLPYKQFRQYGNTFPKLNRNLEALKEFKQVAARDLTIRACLDIIIKAIISSTDRVIHPDPDIANFCNYALQEYEDSNSTSWQSMLETPIFGLMESGFSVSEVIFNKNQQRQLILEDLITYDPTTILMYPDAKGRMVESKSSYHNAYIPSGFYQLLVSLSQGYSLYDRLNRVDPIDQSSGFGMTRLPRQKVVYLRQHAMYGNHYGISSIAPLYRWVLLKEAFIDMMAGALDRYGNPLFYITLPDLPTGITESDDEGIARAITTFETLRSQLEGLGTQGNALLLPFVNKDLEPKIGQIVQPQNIGSVFTDAIEYCNVNIATELGVPPFLLLSSRLESSNRAIPEHQMAAFWANIEDYRSKILNAICRQVFKKIIEYNFDNLPGAKYAPSFSRVYGNRAEDRVATMQVIQGLVKSAALNPQEQIDFDIMRQMVGIPARPVTPLDRDLYNRLYTKAVKQPTGGRTPGSVKPQETPRPKTRTKPTGAIEPKS